MAEPFLAEIRLMSFGYAPQGRAMCNGQLLPINQNQALFSLLGTTYGGDGRVTFALPDLRSRVPLGAGNAAVLGERAGLESVTLQLDQIPAHTHTIDPSLLTEEVRGDREWLRLMRPWYGHSAHMHIRFRCPADQRDCVQAAPPPPGDGCDATLEWWFDQLDAPPKPSPPYHPPLLPAACKAVMAAP